MRTAIVKSSLIVVAATVFIAGCASTGTNRDSIEPPFEWDPAFASPGTSLTLTKSQDTEFAVPGLTYYQIKATGFSPEEPLYLWSRTGPDFSRLSGAVDAEGVFLASGATLPLYSIFGFAPGQAFDVALVSDTTGKRAHAKVFPFPIEAQGTGGTSASAELALATGRHFLITFRGFQPGEEVQITSRYETEVRTSSVLASQDGEITVPVGFGRGDHGKAVATASGKTGTVSLEYGVGMDAFRRQ